MVKRNSVKIKVDYLCNVCIEPQTFALKSDGQFYCPSCLGLILGKFNEYEEVLPQRTIEKTEMTFWTPICTVKSLRLMIKDDKIKVKPLGEI